MTVIIAFPICVAVIAGLVFLLAWDMGDWPYNRGEWARDGAMVLLLAVAFALMAGGVADLGRLLSGA